MPYVSHSQSFISRFATYRLRNHILVAATGVGILLQTLAAGGNALQILDYNGNLVLNTTGSGSMSMSGNLTVHGTTTFPSLDCTGNANGGALTADATGLISCSDDDTGGGGGNFTGTASTLNALFYAVGTNSASGADIFYDDATGNLSMSGAISIDGAIQAQGGVVGALTGNADTATALAANGANCAAGEIPLGVDASGAAESCYEPTEADITDLVHTTDTFTQIYDNGVDVTTNAAILDIDGGDFTLVESPADTFDITITDDGHAHTTTSISGLVEADITDLSHFTPTTIDTDYGSETVTSTFTFTASGTGIFGEYDAMFGDITTPDYGGIRIGNAGIYRTNNAPGAMDFGGAVVIRQEGNLDALNDPGIEFAIIEGGNTVRYMIMESGADNAVTNFRSLIVGAQYSQAAGNQQGTCSYHSSYDSNIDCDTGATGGDLFVVDDFELEGNIYVSGGNIQLDSDDANSLTISTTNLTAARTFDFPDDEIASGDLIVGDAAGSFVYTAKSAINLSDFNDDLTHTTDTNANTICTGTDNYLDGEGGCDALNGLEDFETATDDSVVVGNGTTFDTKAIADCDDGSGHLNYDTATNTFSCGTTDDDVPEAADYSNLTASGGIANSPTGTLSVDLVTAGADADSTTSQSDSGLEFVGGKLTLIRGCADDQILKWDEAQDDWNCEADAGAAGGDSITVDTVAVTDPDFADGGDIGVTDTSNTITWDINSDVVDFGDILYTNTLAGNPALGVDECYFVSTAGGGGFICEGSTANTNEQLYLFPDQDSADSTEYIVVADDANVSAVEAGYLDGVTSAIQTQIDSKEGTLSNEAGLYAALSDVSQFWEAGDDINSGSVDGDIITDGEIDETEIGDGTIDFAEINFTNTLAGNPALAVDECFLMADTSGGGIICEGSTADTNEQLYRFPDANGADTTEYIVVADDANVSSTEAGYLDGVTSAIQTQIDSKEPTITADSLTHADIADADQAHSFTFNYLESDGIDADDDIPSVWGNKTANDFLITEIWCETDTGTVTMMLQVDDGTPADVDTVDLACVSTEVEDVSLDGDTTVAAGEELDFAITSTATTPTRVSVTFTGNWVD